MRNLISHFIFCLILIFLVTTAIAAEQTPSSEPLTDEQKLEKVKSYFQSEYQEEDYFRTDRLLLTATGNLKPIHKAPSVDSWHPYLNKPSGTVTNKRCSAL